MFSPQVGEHSCPFHAAAFLVELQRRRLGLSSHNDPIGAGLPWIGQRQTPGKVVDKDVFIVELQRFGNILEEAVAEASSIKIDRLTGHSFRRSGVKHLALSGVRYSTIQWMARHKSDVTMQYVEEAWSEAPREALRLHDVQNLSEMLVTRRTRLEPVQKALETAATNLQESSLITGLVLDKDLLRKEVRRAMIPIKVFNLSSLKIHDVIATSCLSSDPKTWVTKCWWRWAVAVGACKAYFEMHEVPSWRHVKVARNAGENSQVGWIKWYALHAWFWKKSIARRGAATQQLQLPAWRVWHQTDASIPSPRKRRFSQGGSGG